MLRRSACKLQVPRKRSLDADAAMAVKRQSLKLNASSTPFMDRFEGTSKSRMKEGATAKRQKFDCQFPPLLKKPMICNSETVKPALKTNKASFGKSMLEQKHSHREGHDGDTNKDPTTSVMTEALETPTEDMETNFSFLTRMLGEIPFEMSQGDHTVHVYSPEIPKETEQIILEHYQRKGIQCNIYKYDTRSEYLGDARNIEDGVMSPYIFRAQDNQMKCFGSGGIPLIHCDKSGDNAKLLFLSCAHVLYKSGEQGYSIETSKTTIKTTTVNMSLSLKKNKDLSMKATNCKAQCVDFVIEPEFCCLSNNLDGTNGNRWAMDFFLGRMKKVLPAVENMDVGGMSDLICPYHTEDFRTMRVKGIAEITDFKQAKRQLRFKRLYHGGANMAIGYLTNLDHTIVLNPVKGSTGHPVTTISYFPESVFTARFDVPLLPGQSGSMIYAEDNDDDDDDEDGLHIVGIGFASRLVTEPEPIGNIDAFFIQPLWPILKHLETLPAWMNGKFWTPYEFKNKTEFRGKKITF